MSVPTIVVIDDHEPFRRVARAVLAAAGCKVVGEAAGADQARRLLDGMARPDLVLMDVNLGPSSGIDLTRELMAADPELQIVLVSTIDETDLPADFMDAGARGFVPKSTLEPQVIRRLFEVDGALASRAGGCQHPIDQA